MLTVFQRFVNFVVNIFFSSCELKIPVGWCSSQQNS